MSTKISKDESAVDTIESVAAQLKSLIFLLRGEVTTATILAEFVADSNDRLASEYGQTLCRCIKSITTLAGEFEKNYNKLSGSPFKVQAEFKPPEEKNEVDKSNIGDMVGAAEALTNDILVVEDNIVNQTLIRRLLERMGFKVTTVGSGEDAVNKSAKQHFDLIFMDITLPGIDGFETTRQIKQNAYSKKVPIVALSARNEQSDKQQAQNVGMKEYLTKPVDQKSLALVIKQVLSK